MLNRILFFAAISGTLLASCHPTEPHSSQINHDVGQFEPSEAYDFFHAALSREQLQVMLEAQWGSIDFYPAQDPLSQRVNAWARVLYQLASPGFKSNVPVPEVTIVKQPLINGYNVGVQSCAANKIELEDSPGGEADSSVYLPMDSEFALYGRPTDCVDKELSIQEKKALASIALRENPSCYRFTETEGELTTVLTKDCFAGTEEVFDTVRSFENVLFTSSANQIVINDLMLAVVDEADFIDILAHEMSHYFLAHTSATGETFDYPYLIDRQYNLKTKPSPLPANDPLQNLVKKVEAVRSKGDIVKDFPLAGQKYNPWIMSYAAGNSWKFSQSVAEECRENEACKNSCSALQSHLTRAKRINAVYAFPLEPLRNTPKAKAYYSTYENLLEPCLKHLGFNESYLDAFSSISIDYDQAKLKEQGFRTLIDLVNFMSKELPGAIAAHNKAIQDVYTEADEARLGFYTREQQADELSLELIVRAGFPSSMAVESYLSLAEGTVRSAKDLYGPSIDPNALIYGAYTPEQCRKNYETGFKDFIPTGDYALGSHHDDCFRAYNIYREAEAHKDELMALDSPGISMKIDEELWQKLVKDVRKF